MEKLFFVTSLLLLFILLSEVVLAASNQLSIKFRDIVSDTPIENVHAYVEFFNLDTGETIKTIYYIREQFVTNLNPDYWKIKMILDDISTKGKDYFYEGNINLTSDSTITGYAYPVGSIRGTIYDKNGRVVTDAVINFECNANWGETTQTRTNSFGSFSSDCLPVGSCKVTARSGNVIGYRIVEIKRGELQDIDITLEKEVVADYRFFIFFTVVILVFILFVFLRSRKKGITVKKQKITQKMKAKLLNKRMEDMINTLNEKERKVVEYLLNEGKETSQAKIYHSLGISKASLSRTIFSLENKRIVETRRIGKLKKIKLSEWFLRG